MRGCLIAPAVLLVLGGMTAASIYLGTKPEEELTPFERFMYDPGMAILFGLLVVGGVGTAGLTAWRRHQREEAAWAAFTAAHGLARQPDGMCEKAEGAVQGRAVTLESFVSGRGSDASRYQTLRVAVRGAPKLWASQARDESLDFLFQALDKLREHLGKETGDDRVLTGDPALDRQLNISAHLPDTARAWLTPARLQALSELCAGEGQRMEPGVLVHVRARRSQDPAELEAILARLLAIAGRLEASA